LKACRADAAGCAWRIADRFARRIIPPVWQPLRVALTLSDLAQRAQPGESDMATATMWRRFASLQGAS